MSTDAGTPEPPVEPAERRRSQRALLVILAGFLVVAAGIVGGSLLDTSLERIGDARAPVEEACAAARRELQAFGRLDPAVADSDLAERIDTETEVLRAMLPAFEAAEAGNGAGNDALDAWTADWRALLDARDAASASIRTGEHPSAWLPPTAPGDVEAIDGRMDEYADREGVPSCTTRALEADNLDGQRWYRELEGETEE